MTSIKPCDRINNYTLVCARVGWIKLIQEDINHQTSDLISGSGKSRNIRQQLRAISIKIFCAFAQLDMNTWRLESARKKYMYCIRILNLPSSSKSLYLGLQYHRPGRFPYPNAWEEPREDCWEIYGRIPFGKSWAIENRPCTKTSG